MDNNEQVFFDIQSCQFETFSDLTTILHISDRLFFNAIIGPRDGSTKWRSIKTWIKMRPQQQQSPVNVVANSSTYNLDNLSSHSDAEKSDDSSNTSSHGSIYRKSTDSNPTSIIIQTNCNQSLNNNNNTSLPENKHLIDLINTVHINKSNVYGEIANNNILTQTNSNLSSEPTLGISGGDNIANNIEFNQYLIENGDMSNSGNSSTNMIILESNDNVNSKPCSNEISHSLKNSNIESNHSEFNLSNKSKLVTASLMSNTNNDYTLSHPSCSLSEISSESVKNPEFTSFITKIMKQSIDNISGTEVSNSGNISIGCQTISTGDVTVTNIYIE
jgi:hypothetical protein